MSIATSSAVWGTRPNHRVRPPFFRHTSELHPVGTSFVPPERIVYFMIEDRDHQLVDLPHITAGVPAETLDSLGETLVREIVEKDRRLANYRVVRSKSVIARSMCRFATMRDLVIREANGGLHEDQRLARARGDIRALNIYSAWLDKAASHRKTCDDCQDRFIKISASRKYNLKTPVLPLPQLITPNIANFVRARLNGGIS